MVVLCDTCGDFAPSSSGGPHESGDYVGYFMTVTVMLLFVGVCVGGAMYFLRFENSERRSALPTATRLNVVTSLVRWNGIGSMSCGWKMELRSYTSWCMFFFYVVYTRTAGLGVCGRTRLSQVSMGEICSFLL